MSVRKPLNTRFSKSNLMCSNIVHRKHNILFSIIFDMHVVVPLTTITFCKGTCMRETNITKQYRGLMYKVPLRNIKSENKRPPRLNILSFCFCTD